MVSLSRLEKPNRGVIVPLDQDTRKIKILPSQRIEMWKRAITICWTR